jgi:Zn-finger nucleic acid-binding protein
VTPGRAIEAASGGVDDRGVEPEATCPTCKAALKLGADGFWSCPSGHGLGFTLSKAYGRIADDEIAKIWRASEKAAAGKTPCIFCGKPTVTFTVDGVVLDVCRADEALWFDPGELDQLPRDRPDAPPSAEQQRQFAAIMEAFDHDLVTGLAREQGRAILDRLTNHVVREHPGFARLFDNALDGDRLDELEAETEREQDDLAAQWRESA